MIDKNNNIIKWTCSNWFIRDDNLIQITNQNGGNVILNKIISDIWTSIDYEITLEELILKLKDRINKKVVIEIIELLEKNTLIEIIDSENQFDLIFG